MLVTKSILQKLTNYNNLIISVYYRQGRKLSSLPELSAVLYNTKRKPFNVITNDHISYFKNVLDSNRVLQDPDDLLPHNIDWFKNCRGQSKLLLKPKSTEEVSAILKFCNDNNLAICPQGGNTGVVGGSVPVFDEIIISTVLMNSIIYIDQTSGVLVCEAGCILENLDTTLRENGLIMPLDLGAKGNCHIGGNISTNAGGIRLLRYGNLHGSVVGLEAVKANGDVVDCLSLLKKDNTGYHLKHLFIGSEGTLGFVTKVAIQCPVLPNSVNVSFLGVNDFPSVLNLYLQAKSELGEILSAFEMADLPSMNASVAGMNIPHPIGEYPFYVLIETNGSNEVHDKEKLNNFLNAQMESGLICNGVIASDSAKAKILWALREQMSVEIMKKGYTLNYDISMPLVNFYDIVEIMKQHLVSENVEVFGYGHIGDGNVHVQIAMKNITPEIINKIEPYVYEMASKLKGSISAEHGVGYKKSKYLHLNKSNSSISLMKDLKKLMDPKGILNPYKVLPD